MHLFVFPFSHLDPFVRALFPSLSCPSCSCVCLFSMHRQPEHAMSFFLAEMGTEGSIDGNMRLVIKGRYQPKQVESLLKKYIGQKTKEHQDRRGTEGRRRR